MNATKIVFDLGSSTCKFRIIKSRLLELEPYFMKCPLQSTKFCLRTLTTKQKAIKTLELPVLRTTYPDPTTVTAENQYSKIAEAVTPLHHLSYRKQCSIKYNDCKKILHHLGSDLKQHNQYLSLDHKNLPCTLESIRHCPVTESYRNKDEFSCGPGIDPKTKVVGFFVGSPSKTKDSFVCVAPTHLKIIKPEHILVAQMFQEYIQASPLDVCLDVANGYWRNIIVRSNKAGDIMAIVIMHPQQLSQEEIENEKECIRQYFVNGPGKICNIKSLYFQTCRYVRCSHATSPFHLIHGQPYLMETVGHITMRVSPGTFVQVNPWGAEILYETIADISNLSAESTVVDLGAGAGPISLYLAKDADQCVGIEQTSDAVADANFNKSLNGVDNVKFVEGQAKMVFLDVVRSLYAKDLVVIVNPSRGGLSGKEVEMLRLCRHLGRVVYVSCKPSGDAYRNFVQLCQGRLPPEYGQPFVPVRAIPVDMFPYTGHCELIIVFERSITKHY